jgi:hypothetical protein
MEDLPARLFVAYGLIALVLLATLVLLWRRARTRRQTKNRRRNPAPRAWRDSAQSPAPHDQRIS